LGFALSGVAMAAYLFHLGKPMRSCLGILYFSAMELLQTAQYAYLAEPEDNYSMCKSPMNQFLTFLGYVHICFQPVFCNMLLTGMKRGSSLKTRIEGDFIHKLCLLGGLWLMTKYFLAYFESDTLMARSSSDCPNYEWLRDGYDGNMGIETPNLPGRACTFRSMHTSGHLAWAAPLYQSTYFVPSAALHCFLMFAPLLARAENIGDILADVFFFGTGPALAVYLTPSLHEQASIWCFFSMFQCTLAFVVILFEKIEPGLTVKNNGSMGEAPMEYALVKNDKTKSKFYEEKKII